MELVQELEKALKRVTGAKYLEARPELANNVYPFLIAIARQLSNLDDVVSALVEETESIIQPELGQRIMTIFVGIQSISEAVKREGATETVIAAIHELAALVGAVEEEVSSATLSADEEAEEEPEEDEPEIVAENVNADNI